MKIPTMMPGFFLLFIVLLFNALLTTFSTHRMLTMDFQCVKYSVSNQIGTIALNRPEKHNAFDEQLVAELAQAFLQAQKETAVRAVILRAEGDTFCSGADLDYLQRLSQYDFTQNLKDSADVMKLLLQIYTLRKPVIALIQGDAFAEGCGIVSVCDFIIAASENAKFGYTEARTGFIPALVLLFLVRRIGEGHARELVLNGNIINAEEALKLGLISQVVPTIELEQAGIRFAHELITNNSGAAMGLIKELLSRVHGMSSTDALDYASNLNALTRMTDDCKRGIEACLKNEILKW